MHYYMFHFNRNLTSLSFSICLISVIVLSDFGKLEKYVIGKISKKISIVYESVSILSLKFLNRINLFQLHLVKKITNENI